MENKKMRYALKQVEATVTATLAHQPEDDEKCGQFLYDALVKVYNIADPACHEARDKCAAPAVNGAKLREALEAAKNFVDNVGKAALGDNIDAITICQCAAKLSGRIEAALAEPARNCDVGTPEEQRERFSNFCTNNTDPEDIDGLRCDKRCPLYKDHPNCGWEWLHLPYASEATPCSE